MRPVSLKLGALFILALWALACLPVNSSKTSGSQPSAPPARAPAEIALERGRDSWLSGRYKEAAESFLAAYAERPSEEARAGTLGSLVRLEYQELSDLQRRYGREFPGPEAAYLLLYRTAEAGRREHAAALAEYFRNYLGDSPLAPRAEAVMAGLAKGALPPLAFGADYDPRREFLGASPGALPGEAALAVILPLTDKNAGRFAQEALSGARLALKTRGSRLGLTVMDTGGSPERAARLAEEAAADPRIMAAIGPMLSREASAAAQAAARAGLPLIVLAQSSELPGGVFRLFLTPSRQAEAVTRYAVEVGERRSLGIIYPDDHYGRTMLSSFRNEAAALGAVVAAAHAYDPARPDFEALVRNLTGGKAAARRVSTDYQAPVGFTALFLPDSAGPTAGLLPLLAFHDVTKLLFLGSSLWLNQELLAGSGRYLEGAVIPAALTELSQRPESRDFIEAFKAAHGRAPDQFAAYGHDAALAVLEALSRGAGDRGGLRQALGQGLSTPGASAPFRFGPDGEYQAEPALLTIKDKEFILLREAGPAR